MQNRFFFKDHHYLNRLALTTADDTDAIDPYNIIKDFFYSGNITEMKDLFMETCRAALSEKYSWKEGSPGNLLYFYERLEMLVEACFLICTSKKHRNKLSKKTRRMAKKAFARHLYLPCSLSKSEISDPLPVIKSFFEFHSLKQWKQHLYAWMEAGLSNYTVLDSMAAEDILPYHYHIQRLMEACWYTCLQFKQKGK
jgi:hypothetical protein